ncbi:MULTISPECIES: BglG family transcription antiterminator LicT [unclassified Enterococcus]|uniref:BglG family transcription antiterminator LicT n=1 Tax=unclassified Enterococcus TaxID=2608891 RepID=UPI0015579AAF|nr:MULTISPECIES: PRD domain-containing protein [unclassified Enterococcus]MBS7576123.1 PRD domain-containing protein [Enterococcus sp. MMGLQ5-2]MBS7583356.1 PRD domain-containing protein [Enterococcus sp. MMGLQ5-1]NPD11216.1 PRD domain-containing protein [Enterococcus sp. MMGLQ5-1]NPD35959.1 PRD domain-containing protein [Enterococcus sp. MMGLQ5-2]
MVIFKILNNNLVISKNNDDQEIIVRGKGIGFQRKKGQEIDLNTIERIFTPQDKFESEYIQNLLSTISKEYMDIAEEIVNYARENLQLDVTDGIIFSLCDHIHGTVDRQRNGISVPNPMLWDIKNSYPKEFNAGEKAVELVNEKFGINASNNESAFFAYHFIGNQLNNTNKGQIAIISKFILKIIDIIELSFQKKIDKDSINYQRFITHLKFFAQRLFNRKEHLENVEKDFYFVVKRKYPKVYQCSVIIADFLYEEYKFELNKEELLYLMLHIERVTNEERK